MHSLKFWNWYTLLSMIGFTAFYIASLWMNRPDLSPFLLCCMVVASVAWLGVAFWRLLRCLVK